MDAEALFLTELKTIERVASFVARRGRLYGADAEDFVSIVKLRLIENDYAVLRGFEGRCSLRTYLAVVVQRMLLDYRIHLLGKWHPSTQAKRLGDVAVLAERLLVRDSLPFDEVVARVIAEHPDVSRESVAAMVMRLPERRRHVRFVPMEEPDVELAVAPDTAEQDLEQHRCEEVAKEAARCIRAAIDELPEGDRLLFRLRFEAGMTIAQIARTLAVDQKPLYRRLTRSLRGFRELLEARGIQWHEVESIIDRRSVDLDFGFGTEKRGSGPSIVRGLGAGDGEVR